MPKSINFIRCLNQCVDQVVGGVECLKWASHIWQIKSSEMIVHMIVMGL